MTELTFIDISGGKFYSPPIEDGRYATVNVIWNNLQERGLRVSEKAVQNFCENEKFDSIHIGKTYLLNVAQVMHHYKQVGPYNAPRKKPIINDSEAKRYKRLRESLKPLDLTLTTAEENTLKWVSGWDPDTVENLISMFEKSQGNRDGKNRSERNT